MRAVNASAIFLLAMMFSCPLPAGAQSGAEAKAEVPATPVIPSSASTSSTGPASTSPDTVKLLPKLIYPGDVYYAETLAKTGVQGEVKLELEVSKEGKVLAAKILAGSQSDELDKNALDYVNSPNWTLPAGKSADADARYSQSIVFSKDSLLNINSKTCADFNIDLQYFNSIQHADAFTRVAALELIASLFTVQLIKTQDAAEALKYANATEALSQATIDACKEKPDALLIETYVRQAREQGIKF